MAAAPAPFVSAAGSRARRESHVHSSSKSRHSRDALAAPRRRRRGVRRARTRSRSRLWPRRRRRGASRGGTLPAAASSGGQNAHPSGAGGAAGAPRGSGGATSPSGSEQDEQDDAELVVSRDVVARCPKLRAVRQHVAEFDPDMVWLAVLESLGECMGQGGPMAEQTIGVSGDEEHRHVVREVLGSRGVAPTRIIATPVAGAAECQGGADCSKRVEITIAPTLP